MWPVLPAFSEGASGPQSSVSATCGPDGWLAGIAGRNYLKAVAQNATSRLEKETSLFFKRLVETEVFFRVQRVERING
jgi:hypothetical protein